MSPFLVGFCYTSPEIGVLKKGRIKWWSSPYDGTPNSKVGATYPKESPRGMGYALNWQKKTACSAPPLSPFKGMIYWVYSFGTSPRLFVLALVAISIHHRVKVLLWYVAEAWWHWSSSWCTCNLWGREGNGTEPWRIIPVSCTWFFHHG